MYQNFSSSKILIQNTHNLVPLLTYGKNNFKEVLRNGKLNCEIENV